RPHRIALPPERTCLPPARRRTPRRHQGKAPNRSPGRGESSNAPISPERGPSNIAPYASLALAVTPQVRLAGQRAADEDGSAERQLRDVRHLVDAPEPRQQPLARLAAKLGGGKLAVFLGDLSIAQRAVGIALARGREMAEPLAGGGFDLDSGGALAWKGGVELGIDAELDATHEIAQLLIGAALGREGRHAGAAEEERRRRAI